MQEMSDELYQELRRLAAGYLRGERADHTLQATALLHEAVLKISNRTWGPTIARTDLVAAAAQAMRRILVDHARTRNRLKRGGANARTRDELDAMTLVSGDFAESTVDLELLNLAMTELAEVDPEAAKIVELRFFAGLSVDDAATTMSISPRSAARLWSFARAWLFDRLTGSKDGT